MDRAMAADMNTPAFARAFLDQAGWPDGVIEPLAGDASFRRYFRVIAPGRQAVLMDAPPPHEDAAPFVAMSDWLCGNGHRAPAILSRDMDHGLVLLEDFGDRRMREHLDDKPGDEEAIYARAVDELVRLHALPPPQVRPYDTAEYLREVRLLTDWFVPAAGLTVDAGEFDRLWLDAFAALPGDGATTVLRDYHAENIMLLNDGALGLLDFQDALVGHPAYDLVSLLEDARRDVSAELEAAMLARYCATTGAGNAFRDAYWLLGAQRNTKIIGIFTRLWKRDGKPRYLDYLPRMWGLLERDLAQPHLAPLRHWFDANIPAAGRARLS